MDQPLLYLSLAFKHHRSDYDQCLSAVLSNGDGEGWTTFFLACINEAAEDGVDDATRIFRLLNDDRLKILGHDETTVTVLRLFEVLPDHPMITLALATKRLKANKVTALRAIYALEKAKVLYEITGKSRNRVYAYHKYLVVEDTELMDPA